MAPTSSDGIATRWLRGIALCLPMLTCPMLARAQALDTAPLVNSLTPDTGNPLAAPPDSGSNLDILRTISPEIVANFIESSDFYTDVSVDPSGYPIIYVDPGDTGASSIDVAFLHCSALWPDECSTIEVVARFAPSARVTKRVIERWNAAHHVAHAALGAHGSVLLSIAIDSHGGLGRDTLHAQLSRFIDSVYDFGDALVLDLL